MNNVYLKVPDSRFLFLFRCHIYPLFPADVPLGNYLLTIADRDPDRHHLIVGDAAHSSKKYNQNMFVVKWSTE